MDLEYLPIIDQYLQEHGFTKILYTFHIIAMFTPTKFAHIRVFNDLIQITTPTSIEPDINIADPNALELLIKTLTKADPHN